MNEKYSKNANKKHHVKKNPFLNNERTITVTHSSVSSQPRIKNSKQSQTNGLNLRKFKVKKCKKNFKHNHRKCPYFHNPNDFRRVKRIQQKTRQQNNSGNHHHGSRNKNYNQRRNLNLPAMKLGAANVRCHHPGDGNTGIYADNRHQGDSQNGYFSDLCQNFKKGVNCEHGEFCIFSHNLVESMYHDDNYKKRFCNFYPNQLSNCDYSKS